MALPYPTKVILPFDIATAQDMNERHANDVALAAGTGLDDGAVTASKIDFTTFGKVWWEELGRATATGSTTNLSASFTSRKFMKFMATVRCGVASSPTIGTTVNGDSTVSYQRNQLEVVAGAVGGTVTPSAAIINSPSVGNGEELVFEITASRSGASRNWVFLSQMAGSTVKFGRTMWKSNDITSFEITSSVASGLAAGSEIVVLGHD